MELIKTIENIRYIFITGVLVLAPIALIEGYFIMNKMKKKKKIRLFQME